MIRPATALVTILLLTGCDATRQDLDNPAPDPPANSVMDDPEFETLTNFLKKVPGIEGSIGTGSFENGNWWVKFTVDIDHPQAWNVVQEMGHVLNYLSLDERLPTVFMPTSPPPYMNGPARDFLSWVIESTDPEFRPKTCAEWLEGRLPRPVDDLSEWPATSE